MKVEELDGYLQAFFGGVERQPFDGYVHDIVNLRREAAQGQPDHGGLKRYAEDLQAQILSEGLLDLIKCQAGER